MRNTGSKPKSLSALDTNSIAPKFEVTAHSSANNCASIFAQATLKNAFHEVQDAWNKAEEKRSGFNPLTDADGKIAGSSLLAGLIDTDLILDQAQGYTSLRLFSL
ncbi:hypothetical protein J7E78_08725 [Paenibacillus polymyxa]|uniref:hypothetical protein n=1 Tax=Paenibacillus polymyxa TaxID=1406 RepID=UPI001BE99FCC|nr:hypothetical protein [Paenibacillus polymyxa]MBT2283617.1 hypothetical protein [Paenibacillus polymyxa]